MAFRYAAHRSIRVGTCNICQRYGKLSWDHVPPKGSVASEAVEVNPLFRVDDLSDARPVFLQDGVKFRTICPDCNSRIGRRFDPSLINFTRAVKGLVSSSLYLPQFTVLDARPNAIARAVLGHLLAARISDDAQGFDSLIRPSVLDETLPIPQQLEIYYWLYPSGGTVISRHIVVPRGNDDVAMISVLKFHPVAFLVTSKSLGSVMEEIVLEWLRSNSSQVYWKALLAHLDQASRVSNENSSVARNLIISSMDGGSEKISEPSIQKVLSSLACGTHTYLKVDQKLRFVDYQEVGELESKPVPEYKLHPDFLHPVWSKLEHSDYSAHLTGRGDQVILSPQGLLASCRRGKWHIYDVFTLRTSWATRWEITESAVISSTSSLI